MPLAVAVGHVDDVVPVAATAISFSFGSCFSVASRSGTLLVMMMSASFERARRSGRARSARIRCIRAGSSGVRTLALSVSRSRKTILCDMKFPPVFLFLRRALPSSGETLSPRRCAGSGIGHDIFSSGLARKTACAAATPEPGSILMPLSSIAISAPAMAPQQHQLVEVAEVADAEHLAGDLRQAGAEREVVAAEGAARSPWRRRSLRAPRSR